MAEVLTGVIGLQWVPHDSRGMCFGRAHPRFVLQRHIKRYSALKPGTRLAGLHRGEPYYQRSALQELHTVCARETLNPRCKP